MKILQVHNRYRLSGGEDTVVEEERRMLMDAGHQVIQYTRSNEELAGSFIGKLNAVKEMRWSHRSYQEIRLLLKKHLPDVCHVHNIFFAISPAVYQACHDEGVAVVHTLHNYRLMCVNSYLFRDGQACELCVTGSRINALKFKCYNNARIQSGLIMSMLNYHWKKKTWVDGPQKFIVLTDFARDKFIEAGIPREKIVLKPNFVKHTKTENSFDDFLLYVGRVEKNKGFDKVIQLAQNYPDVKIVAIGDVDPCYRQVKEANLKFTGHLERLDVDDYLSKCRAVIFPSLMYEGMPMTILEAFMHHKPVIASNHGAMATLIGHGKTGLLYDSQETFEAACFHLVNDKAAAIEMGESAYISYLSKYAPEANYQTLLSIYQGAISELHEGI
jgi:glycosyltransferase involved in cell wall biosynthesis